MKLTFKKIIGYHDTITAVFGFIIILTHFELILAAILPFGWIFLVFDAAADFEDHHYEEMMVSILFGLLIASHYKVKRGKREMNQNAIRGVAIITVMIILFAMFGNDIVQLPSSEGELYEKPENQIFTHITEGINQQPLIYTCAIFITTTVSVRLAPVIYDYTKEYF